MKDSDLIRRDDVKKKLSECLEKASPPLMYPNWNDAVLAVMTAPAVDAVEVVRCENCDMANACSDEREMYCSLYHAYKPIYYFCADGRREEEHNALD